MGNVRWDDFFFGEAGFEGVLPLIVVVGFEDVTEFVDESLDVGFEGEGRRRTGFGVVTSFDAGEKGFRHERKNEVWGVICYFESLVPFIVPHLQVATVVHGYN
ncbi:hypothetical protein CsSME_00022120 [Camellia sinensis var. sinensis]